MISKEFLLVKNKGERKAKTHATGSSGTRNVVNLI